MKPVYYASAYLYDYHTGVNGVYISPSFSPYPNITFIFCIAEPAAPFMRLSDAESATTLLLSSSISKPISQKLEPIKNFGSGNLYNPFLSLINLINGSL